MSYISIIFTCICGIVVRVCESFSNSFQSYFLSIPACLMAWRKEVRFATIHNIVTQLKCAFHSAEAWTITFLIFTQIRKQYKYKFCSNNEFIYANLSNITEQVSRISCKQFVVDYFKPVKFSLRPIIPRVNKLAISDITYLECKLIYLPRITPNNITSWPRVLIRHWFKIIQQDGGQIRFLQSSRICRINHFQRPTA